MTRVLIEPRFRQPDKGDGGIRRVVEAQRKYLPQFGVEVVDSEAEADVVAVHAGMWIKTNKPTVTHCHGLYWEEHEWPTWAHSMNQDVVEALRRADVVTAPSEWVANILRRGMWLSPEVLYHGIDPDEWPETISHENYVLWNKTRVDPICDPSPMNTLAAMAPSVQFVSTYGDESIANLRVTGTLPHDEARDAVRRTGIYLATSRETFGIGTLEAMAAGVPVLGWVWGGQPEIVKHKVHGWLATPGDFDGLLEGLKYCMEHRAELGAAARVHTMTNFTWQVAIARYARIYKELHEHSLLKRPKVSVVIPAYNMAELLPDAVKSVVSQDYDDYEIIIVDDASTDATLAVASAASAGEYSRIRVISNPSNQYLAETLNTGVKLALGEYIIPLDADNRLGKGSLRVLAESLDKDRSIDIAYGAMRVLEEDGKEWVSPWPQDFKFYDQVSHRNQITSTAMYRRRAWERVGGYRRRCRTAEDADFWCRTTSFGMAAKKVTDMVVLEYRNRPDSMSHVESDWAWHNWYPWHKDQNITPFGAVVDRRLPIPTYEPVVVSVIIPVGPGHDRLVLDALDSLQAQTYRFFEAIVVNDTGMPFDWIHPWAKVVDGHARKGTPASRNLGMRHAKGRLFLFLDADDYLQPEALEAMVAVQESVGGFVYTDWYAQEDGKAVKAPEYNCSDVLKKQFYPVTCLYPRSVYEDTGGFDESFDVGWEDWDFALRVAKAGYCGTRIPIPMLHYRIHSGARREQAYKNRNQLEKKVYDIWEPYITGKETLMACGGCGRKGGGASSSSAMQIVGGASALRLPAADEDVMLLQFTEPGQPPRTYIGKSSKQKYRFGSDQEHRVRYVKKQDAEELLRLPEFAPFKPGLQESKPLEAAGPPVR